MARTRSVNASRVLKPARAEAVSTAERRTKPHPKPRTASASTESSAAARRRPADPSTTHREESTLETEFIRAMHEYKKSSGRMFPTWSEVLEVLQHLGYRKLGEESSSVTEAGLC